MGRAAGSSLGGKEAGVSPVIGSMFVFVIIVMGLAGALAFGVPTITTLQERAAFDDMATQLEGVRDDAEKLTVGGAGAVVTLAPTEGSLSVEEGTRMAVAISYNGSAEQQGLSLAWGKGGKKKSTVTQSVKACDFHVQDWEDGNNQVTLVAKDCYTPMRWDPADSGSGVYQMQTLDVTSVVASNGWSPGTATQPNLVTANSQYANYTGVDLPPSTDDLRVAFGDPVHADSIKGVVVKAKVTQSGADQEFKLKACLASACGADSAALDPDAQGEISYNVTRKHPDGGSARFDDGEAGDWAQLDALVVSIALQGKNNELGTWRVDRVWVEVTSGPDTSGGNNDGECFDTSATADVACLQAFRTSDAAGVNRITSIAAVSGQDDTYLLTLNTSFSGDWYFQLSSDPRSPSTEKLLAKAYIFNMDRLRWSNAGMSTWLEGGGVFAHRSNSRYTLTPPIVDEDIPDTDSSQPTFYARIIRFDGDSTSMSGGASSQLQLRHEATFSTANDGVSVVRFDFVGEGAQVWCESFLGRSVPAGYAYKEHPSFTCKAGNPNGVRSVRYGYDLECNASQSVTQCLQYLRANKKYFQVVFAEVLYDIRLQP